MATHPPVIYYLFGTDEFAISAFIQTLRSKLGDDTNADMNTTHFDGSNLNMATFEETCMSMPFLTDRRIVVLNQANQLPKKDPWLTHFMDLLSRLPRTTALVIVEIHDVADRKKRSKKASPLLLWANEHRDRCFTRQFDNPEGLHFVSWLKSRSVEGGGDISEPAAQLLAEYVVEDPRLADMELGKLLDYVDRSRQIEVADVEKLTPFTGQADVFELVDAMGARDSPRAQRLLHQLMQSDDAHYAFAMIARQVRLLILVRDCLDRGTDPAKSLGKVSFLARRLSAQAQNFSLPDLEYLYQTLFEIDVSVKRGKIALEPSMDNLIASLSTAASIRQLG
jgi:DNA polymerase-3 subunit delta